MAPWSGRSSRSAATYCCRTVDNEGQSRRLYLVGFVAVVVVGVFGVVVVVVDDGIADVDCHCWSREQCARFRARKNRLRCVMCVAPGADIIRLKST